MTDAQLGAAVRALCALRSQRWENLHQRGPMTQDQYADVWVCDDLDFDRLTGGTAEHRRYGLEVA